MIGSKPVWASKTIWGGLAVLLVAVLKMFGFDIGEELAGELGQLVESAALLIAAAVVLWGRVVATRRIEGTPPPSSIFCLLLPTACCLLLLSGCSHVSAILDPELLDADAERYRAVAPVIGEHVERHPDQKTTWDFFLATWRESIEARGGYAGGGVGAEKQ